MTATLPLEKRRDTLEEFESMPQGLPKFECDEGEIIALASPILDHADITAKFSSRTWVFEQRPS